MIHLSDVLAVVAAYARSGMGFLARKSRPYVLQSGILARIPLLDYVGQLVEPITLTPGSADG